MKCTICAKETEILTQNQLCPDCDKKYNSPDADKPDPSAQDKPLIMPKTTLGMLAAIITFLTICLFAIILLTSKTALFLTIIIALFTTIPAIVSMIMALIAFKGLHDRSKIVIITLITSSALAVLSIPIAMAVSLILPPGSLLPGGFW
jgi:hypothetical protein